MSTVYYLAVLHRSGNAYVIDVYPHEAESYIREERRHRAIYARAFGSRSEATGALNRVQRHRRAIADARRFRRMFRLGSTRRYARRWAA
jgi:hypothetical protein